MASGNACSSAFNAMRILGYMHTFNDTDVIDDTLRALCEQTYPIPEILIVDNASTDGTLQRSFPDQVTVIIHDENLGTSGTVITGFQYAIAHNYDWIYLLDADSQPQKDAVEKLIGLYKSLSPTLQEKTWWLGSLPKEARGNHVHHGAVFTPSGVHMVHPEPEQTYYECHTNMWTGSLYRLEAVQQVGLPDPDYVLDWGDVIYGYEGMVRGYKAFIHQQSIVLHNLHPMDTLQYLRFGARYVKVFYSSPIRFYYLWRNQTYFWLYKFQHRRFCRTFLPHFSMFLRWIIKTVLFLRHPTPILRACLRGFWDGIRRDLHKRY